MTELKNAIANMLPELIDLRRDLHAHPQPGYRETHAAECIARFLADRGIEHALGLAETGVVGWLVPTAPASASRPAVALRADMDALSLDEQTDLPHASQNPGCMHACGHDGHVAMLLGTAAVLAQRRDDLPAPVKFLFQPAEEGGGGAEKLIQSGALTETVGGVSVGSVFGLHGDPGEPLGTVATRTGPIMARVDSFTLTVFGSGGHAANPHLTRDPILAAAHVVTALQSVVSRNAPPHEPAVVSVAAIQGGTTCNVIPERVILQGTVRTCDDPAADTALQRVRDVIDHTARALGCSAEIDFHQSYPAVVNDPAATDTFRHIAVEALGPEHVLTCNPTTIAEDFACYAREVPACLAFLGLRPTDADTAPPLHSPLFDFNDDALPLGVELFCRLAMAPPDP